MRMTYRILALDGGGAWALLQAMALDRLYGGLDGHAILRRFDLAAANSGGSIVLAGLVKGLKPAQIAALLLKEEKRRSIFVARNPLGRAWSSQLAKYDPEGKRAGLRALMNEGRNPVADLSLAEAAATIGAGAPGLMIAAYDVDRNRGRFFRSFNTQLSTEQPHPFEPSLCDAVHASTHAPIFYFAECATVADRRNPADRRRFWDGALAGMNNPVMAAVIDAYALGQRDIAALSIGTGTVWRPLAAPDSATDPALVASEASLQLFASISRVAGTILDDPPDNATRDADLLISTDQQRLVRLNPVIRPERNAANKWDAPASYDAIGTDGALAAFRTLADMDMDAVAPWEVTAIKQLGERWLADAIPNQAIRWNPTDGQPVTGQIRFSDALSAWRQLDPFPP
jgi:hypothetical protein